MALVHANLNDFATIEPVQVDLMPQKGPQELNVKVAKKISRRDLLCGGFG